jgi:hypothetical protein
MMELTAPEVERPTNDHVPQLSQADRNLVEVDIRATLDTFKVQIGTAATDRDMVLWPRAMATSLDVGVGVYPGHELQA